MPANEIRTDVLLTAITHLESGAFRAGQVARHLLEQHPDLTVRRATCSTYSYADIWDAQPSVPRLDLRVVGLDDARAWAAALDTALTVDVRDDSGSAYEHGECTATVDGVTVRVTGSRTLPDDEATAWRAQQTATPDGGDA
ncbi:hypothetical protein [Streptomyces antibioticus]|uniref:hypothetical protein n=1 Tax=Streptomyces antibioticus TaxID=1890 RepID=UPI0033BD679A